MGQLQVISDPSGATPLEQLNEQNIAMIIDEMNRGPDVTMIQRRTIGAGMIKVLSYQPGPFKLHAGATLAAGSYSTLVLNFTNNGLTAGAGQTFIPTFLADVFVDPPNTSSTSALYAGGFAYPDGINVTTAMANLSFTPYLRDSTPGTSQDVVSYILQIRNFDANPHAYWAAVQMLLPADGNLNDGSNSVYLP